MLLLIYKLDGSFWQLLLFFEVVHTRYSGSINGGGGTLFLRIDLSVLHNDLSLTFNNFNLFAQKLLLLYNQLKQS